MADGEETEVLDMSLDELMKRSAYREGPPLEDRPPNPTHQRPNHPHPHPHPPQNPHSHRQNFPRHGGGFFPDHRRDDFRHPRMQHRSPMGHFRGRHPHHHHQQHYHQNHFNGHNHFHHQEGFREEWGRGGWGGQHERAGNNLRGRGGGGFGREFDRRDGEHFERRGKMPVPRRGVDHHRPVGDGLSVQNCIVEMDGVDVTVKLDGTKIITVRPNGDLVLDTGGHQVAGMLQTFNDILNLLGVEVIKKEGAPNEWSVKDGRSLVRFYDGLVLKSKGVHHHARGHAVLQAFSHPNANAAVEATMASNAVAQTLGLLPDAEPAFPPDHLPDSMRHKPGWSNKANNYPPPIFHGRSPVHYASLFPPDPPDFHGNFRYEQEMGYSGWNAEHYKDHQVNRVDRHLDDKTRRKIRQGRFNPY